MEIIILGVLLGIAIIALGVIAIVQVKEHSKSNRELQRLLKARDLQENSIYGTEPESEEEIIDDSENYVSLEDMDTVVNERE